MYCKEKILNPINIPKSNSILDSSLVPKNNQVLINILTRTSNRPSYFAECRNSIVNQSYKNIRHIVSVDDDYSYNYVKENGLLNQDILQLERPYRMSTSHMPYNLYMNNLINEVKQGWIMFLDDDDLLFDSNSISILVNNLPSIPSIMIFKTRVKDDNLPKLYFKKKIVKGDITSNCFVFHSLFKNKSHWIDQKGSDFYFLNLLSQNVKVFWLNQVLSKVNNKNIMGKGFRQDKNLTTLRLEKLLIDNNFLDKLEYFLKYNNKVGDKILRKDYMNQYFDHIYVLSLERRFDKFCKTVNRLQNNDIFNFERFLGIDGNLKEIKNIYNSYLYHQSKNKYGNNYIPSSGSYAILLSMKNMLLDAIKNKYQRILVLQDDIIINTNFKILLKSYENILNSNWKLIYLGASQHNWKNIQFDLEKRLYYCRGTDGAFAVGINSIIFELLIELIDKAVLPFDSGPLTNIQKMFPQDCFVLFPNLIIADVSDSDCRKSRDQNIMSQKFRWDQKYDFDFYNKNNFFEPISQEKCLIRIKNKDILVTIIVLFNQFDILNEDTINNFFNSLIYQTYENFELIVILEDRNRKENKHVYQKIDDLLNLEKKKKVTIKIKKINNDLYPFCEEIIKISNGDYILFINRQFYFYNNIIEYLLSFLINYKQFSGCLFTMIDIQQNSPNDLHKLFEINLFLISKDLYQQISKFHLNIVNSIVNNIYELIIKLKSYNYRFYLIKNILPIENTSMSQNKTNFVNHLSNSSTKNLLKHLSSKTTPYQII